MINDLLRHRLKQNNSQLANAVSKLINQKNEEYGRVFAGLHKRTLSVTVETPNQLRIKYAKIREARQANWEKHRQVAEQLAKEEELATKQQEEEQQQAFRMQHRTACLQQLQHKREARIQLTASLQRFRKPNVPAQPLYQRFEEQYLAQRNQQKVVDPPQPLPFRLSDLRDHLSWYKAQQQHRSSFALPMSDRRFSSSLGTKLYKEDQMKAEEGKRLKQQVRELVAKQKNFSQSVKRLRRPRVSWIPEVVEKAKPPVQREVREWKPPKFAPNPMVPDVPPPKPQPKVVDYLGDLRSRRAASSAENQLVHQPTAQQLAAQKRISDALVSSIKAKLSSLNQGYH